MKNKDINNGGAVIYNGNTPINPKILKMNEMTMKMHPIIIPMLFTLNTSLSTYFYSYSIKNEIVHLISCYVQADKKIIRI